MRIRYNAPTVLTFTLFCAVILFLTHASFPSMMVNWFAVPGKNTFEAGNMRHWITIFTHIMGHANWTHFIGNFTLILLIGPMLEESYGSLNLLIMILITAFVTGLLNILFLTRC